MATPAPDVHGSQGTRSIVPLAMLLLGSLLIGFSHGQWLAPLAAWLGPALVLRYARDHSVGRGYLLVLLGQVLAIFIGFGDFFPAPMGIFIVVGYGFLLSLPYLADRLLNSRLPGFAATLAYPLAATTLEFVTIHANPMGTWGSTGFTQYGVLPVMQLASLTGMIGITFMMGWFAAVANWVWENRSDPGGLWKGVVAFGSALALVLAFGYARLNLAPPTATGETVRVAGITAQGLDAVSEQTAAQDINPLSPAAQGILQRHWEAYFDATEREAATGARVIVWAEASGLVPLPDEAARVAEAQDLARKYGLYLAVPMVTGDPETGTWLDNKLVLINPSGQVAFEHIKYGGALLEVTRAGDGVLQQEATPFGILSGVICYDMDYPAVIRQTGQKGVGLLLVPSRDWREIDPVHSHMAVFRGVENGMSVVRQVDTGLSIAADAYGRVLAQTDYFGAEDRTMVVQVPTRHVPTIYSMFGSWLEWLAPIGFLVLVGYALLRKPAGAPLAAPADERQA
jgi:apolipoprotein N-acyltransferase